MRAGGLVLAAILALPACTGDDGPADEPVALDRPATVSPRAPTEPSQSARPAPSRDDGDSDRSVRVKDRASRRTASGDVPAYVEIERASVVAQDGGLLFTARLAGDVPRQSSGPATLRVSFQVLVRDGERFDLTAQASDEGWTATSTVGDGNAVPVTLYVGARSIEILMDESYVGPRPFRWLANVAWSKGTAYGFDSAPERGYADFPG